MFKHTLANLVASAVPAVTAESVVTGHEVRFDQMSFIRGEKNESGKTVGLIQMTLGAACMFLFLAFLLLLSSAGQAQQLSGGERERTYTYEKELFICAETSEKEGKRRRLIGEPYEPRLPMMEPKKDDPLWKSWDIIFKVVCKNFDQQPNLSTAADNRNSVR